MEEFERAKNRVTVTRFRDSAPSVFTLGRSDKISPMRTTAAIPVARRVSGFVYAIRNIVAEARKVEAGGKKVRYLNIGDPITFGFKTPPHMIEAVERRRARRWPPSSRAAACRSGRIAC